MQVPNTQVSQSTSKRKNLVNDSEHLMKLTESTIEQELERFRTGSVTLSELTLAIERLQQTEQTNQAKVRKTNTFLGQLAQQLNLPGMFTLPSGRHFVYTNRGTVRTKSALPEYMTAREVMPLAQRNLIPTEARRLLAELITANSGSELGGQRAGDVDPSLRPEPQGDAPRDFVTDPNNGEMLPADSAAAAEVRQAARDAEDARAENPAAQEPDPIGDIARGSHLERFASSGKGGLKNDPDEENAIRELQRFLTNELELNTGSVDGRYGGATTRAVRRFQQAITGVTVDGDAGPETIGKIIEIRRDMARIRELVSAIGESAIPVKFKSGLAQLLERTLTQQERTELEQLVNKYRGFREAFPRFEPSLFIRAEEIANSASAPTVSTDAPAQPPAPRRDTAPTTRGAADRPPATNTPNRPSAPASDARPSTPGAPEVRSAASVVADPNNTSTAADPEAATFVQDNPTAIRQLRTAIRGAGTDEDTIFRVMNTIRSQQQWDQLQREYYKQYQADLVDDLVGDLGGIFRNINSTDMVRYVWDPLRRAGVEQTDRLNHEREEWARQFDQRIDAIDRSMQGGGSTPTQPADPRINRVPGAQTQSVDYDNLNYIKEMVRKICR